jgi:hypothetical protein
MSNVNFSTRRSLAAMDEIFVFLEANEGVIAKQIEAAVGMSCARCNVFLNQMRKQGRILSSGGANSHNGRQASTWSVNADYVPADVQEDHDEFEMRVTVRKKWKPNHVRDLLDCFLFGVPAAMVPA